MDMRPNECCCSTVRYGDTALRRVDAQYIEITDKCDVQVRLFTRDAQTDENPITNGSMTCWRGCSYVGSLQTRDRRRWEQN